MSNLLIQSVESREPNPNIPELRPGDTVRVHNRIIEGNRGARTGL
jgi:ribosomal protein L19